MSTRRERQEAKDRKANRWMMWVGITLVVIAAFYAYVKLGEEEFRMAADYPDGRRLWCWEDRDPEEVWVVLFDVTNRYEEIPGEWIRNKFNRLKSAIPDHALLEVYLLGNDAVSLEPRVSLCNPGGRVSSRWWDPFIDNPAMNRRNWEDRFDDPLNEVLDNLFEEEEAAWSSILEQLQAITVSALQPFPAALRRVVVVSDFLHHTAEFSHYYEVRDYGDVQDYGRFKALDYYNRVQVSMKGIEVQMWYVHRPGKLPSFGIESAHGSFWRSYLRDMQDVETLTFTNADGSPGGFFCLVGGPC